MKNNLDIMSDNYNDDVDDDDDQVKGDEEEDEDGIYDDNAP